MMIKNKENLKRFKKLQWRSNIDSWKRIELDNKHDIIQFITMDQIEWWDKS